MNKTIFEKGRLSSINHLSAPAILPFFLMLLFAVLPAWGVVDKEAIKPKLANISIPFIENQGQIKNGSVKFYANTFAGTVFITENGEIVYSLKSKENNGAGHGTKQSQKDILRNSKLHTPNAELTKGWVLKEKGQGFKGSGVRGLDKAETKINYFIGNKKENWKNDIPSYYSISLDEIYDGIELKLKAYGNNVEKLFVVNPQADISKIAMSLEGAKSIQINKSGDLEIETGLGTLKFTKPYAYQEIAGNRVEISAGFSVRNSGLHYGFNVASYNKDYPLIIDPLLSSTFIGGTNDDIGYSIATDLQGNVFITGATLSSDYPTTPGAYDRTCGTDGACNGGFYDVVVSKFNNNLTSLLASTFIGGSNHDEGFSIAIGPPGLLQYVYVTGRTESADYPTTPGAYDTGYNGGRDVFVSKLDINLATLLASTYIGGSIDGSMAPGSGDEGGHDIALDYDNTYQYVIYVTGWTDSLDYPTTPGAYDPTYNGGISDVIVSKFNNNLTTLLASTYIGGTDDDGGYSITLAPASGDGIYVTGWTNSGNYPTTPGAYDQTYNGGWDVLVSNLDINLSILMASTYIGGGNDDGGNSIAITNGPNLYVTGETNSPDYPTTPGAYDRTCGTDGNCNGGFYDVLVSRLDLALSNTPGNYIGTFIGGSNDDMGAGLLRDSWRRLIVRACGDDIYLTGRTMSSDYPATPVSAASPGTYDQTYNGGWDVLVSSLNNNLTTLLASTFIGGSNNDRGYSIATDLNNLFITGQTNSSSYPTPPGAYDTTYNGGEDVFVSKFICNSTLPTLVGYNPQWLIITLVCLTLIGGYLLRKRIARYR